MATATVKFNISSKVPLGDAGQKTVRYFGSLSFSAAADTYATGGLLPTSGFALKNLGPYGDRTPLMILFQSSSGFNYQWDSTNGKLKVFSGNSSGSGTTAEPEITNGTALNATTPAISTDVITFEAVFPRQ